LILYCGGWLVVSGLRKKGRERALVVSGCAIIALDAYVAALVAFGPTLLTSGIGLWMSALGGAVLLVMSRPIATRRKGAKAEKPAKAAKPKKEAPQPKPKTNAKAEAKPDAAKAKAPKSDAAATTKAATETDADKRAKLERLRKLKKLKEQEELEAKVEAQAAKEDAETAKAGAKLASEPEPSFAADPTAAAAPENEDRESLMKRMGVKPPPPPSDTELEDMLAAFKKKAGVDK
jgi:hypothetical protein